MTDTSAQVAPMFAPAVKEKLKARVAIDGPTGSGKTWTALQWARILAGPDGPIGVIDTENRSAAYYAPGPGEKPQRMNWWDPPYEFGHLPKQPPYDPRELRQLIIAAGQQLGPDGVLVIDSLTHFWTGEGGTLDVVDDASSRGNSFTGWKEGTPAQRGMLDAIIHASCHVVVTMRSKMEYLLVEEVKNGRKITVPTKVGMAPEQRAGVEYEFTVVADMDLEHRLIVSKSRCSLIADVVAPLGRSHEPAVTFAEWLDSGVERVSEDAASAVTERINSTIENEEARKHLKMDLVRTFGKPAELTTDLMPQVNAWLDQRLAPFLPQPPADEGVSQDEPIPPDPEPEVADRGTAADDTVAQAHEDEQPPAKKAAAQQPSLGETG